MGFANAEKRLARLGIQDDRGATKAQIPSPRFTSWLVKCTGIPSLSIHDQPVLCLERDWVLRIIHLKAGRPYLNLQTSTLHYHYRYNVTVPMPGNNGCCQNVQPKRSTAHHRDHRVRSRDPFHGSDCCSVCLLHSLLYPCPIVLIDIRFYVRKWIVGRVDLSDYIMATALVS